MIKGNQGANSRALDVFDRARGFGFSAVMICDPD
jgi:hypothetical protein